MQVFVGTTIQRRLFFQLAGPFVFCFLTIMFLLLMQFLILHIDKLVGKGLPFMLIVELILSSLAYMAVLAVPMSVLVSNLMVYGKLAETNEFTAIKMAGVPALRIITPALLFGGLLMGVMVWFSDSILPEANLKARSLFIDIRLKKPGFDLKENTFYNGIQGYVFYVRKVDSQKDSLYDIMLIQEANVKRDFAIARAKRGHLRSEDDRTTLTLWLHEGEICRIIPERADRPRKLEVTRFGSYRISFDLSELAFSRSNPHSRKRTDRTMSFRALTAYIDSMHVEIHSRDDQFTRAGGFLFADDLKPHNPRTPHSLFKIPYLEGETLSDSIPAINTDFTTLKVFKTAVEQYDLLFRASREVRRDLSDFESHLMNRKWLYANTARYDVERHKKISLPFACVVFVLIGAPLGLYSKKGSLGNASVISAILFTYYWITLIQGEKMADRLFISPWTGMWLGNGTILLGGLVLMIWIQRDGKWKRRLHDTL
jgi:lipopolysaccharide export system permease protein